VSSQPTAAPVLSKAARDRYTLAFDTDHAELYHGVRPGYQADILDFLTTTTPGLAVDMGAGTGLFTERMLAAGWDVVAVDPAPNMLSILAQRAPQATTVVSTVEDLETTGLAHRAQLVVSAQAWHWIDTEIGCQKVAELLTDDGIFGIVHHQIDTSIPWVLRLCKIMHSGDIHPIDQPPEVTKHFSQPVGKWWHWQQALTVDKLHQLMMTRAFYLRTNNRQRHRMHNNLNWYLLEHLGYAPESTVYVPYLTAAWRMQRSQLG